MLRYINCNPPQCFKLKLIKSNTKKNSEHKKLIHFLVREKLTRNGEHSRK